MSFSEIFKIKNKNNPNMTVFFNTATCGTIVADSADIKNLSFSDVVATNYYIKLPNDQLYKNTYGVLEQNIAPTNCLNVINQINTFFNIQQLGGNIGDNRLYLQVGDTYTYSVDFSSISTVPYNLTLRLMLSDTNMPTISIVNNNTVLLSIIRYNITFKILNITPTTCQISNIQEIILLTTNSEGQPTTNTIYNESITISGVVNNIITADLFASVSSLPTNRLAKMDYIFNRK